MRYVTVPALAGAVVGLTIVMLLGTREAPPQAPGFAGAVAKAAPAVVNIYSSQRVPANQHPICRLPRYREMCQALQGRRGNVQSSLGSGVVMHTDGYILTNNHVIGHADEILVAFNDGQQAQARIVGRDPETDLAVIKVETSGLAPIDVAESDSARIGDMVLAIGNPFGIGQTVSLGIVSAKGRYYVSDSPYDDFIQTDAAINPGNSGGALINADGALIGVNTLIYTQSGGSEGIGFAIPSDLATMVMDEIIEFGRVQRGFLGVLLDDRSTIDDVGTASIGVRQVVSGGPADVAGIRPGDFITGIDREPTTTPDALRRQVAMKSPGTLTKISLIRNGHAFTVEVEAGLRPLLERL